MASPIASPPLFFLLLILASAQLHFHNAGVWAQSSRQEWDASSYPNPTADGFQRCNMRTTAAVCDPDAVLTDAERQRLNYELNQLEARTRQPQGRDFCEKRGIVGAIAIAKHVRGGSENAVKTMANDMLQRWNLDQQCHKSVMLVVAVDDRKFWTARDTRVPVYGQELSDIFGGQRELFRSGQYSEALQNFVKGVWAKALEKQGTAAQPAPEGPGGVPFQPSRPMPPAERPSNGISWGWIIPLALLVLLPLLCCCGCIYFCCFRGRGGGGASSSPRYQGPAGVETGGVPPRGGGGLGSGTRGFLGGLGGGVLANQAMNWFRGGSRQPAAAGGYPPPSAPGGYYGGTTTTIGDDVKPSAPGLYPSVERKDEGGGGSW